MIWKKISIFLIGFIFITKFCFGAVENFTTYTEVDGGGDPGWLSVSENLIDGNTIQQDSDTYVYADKGADHFGASWDIDFTANVIAWKANSWDWCALFGLTNTLDDIRGWDINNNQALNIQAGANFTNPDNNFFIRDDEDASNDVSADFTLNTTYYFTFLRTSETAVSCEIYTDSARTSLFDTIATTITSGRRYRYAELAISYNNSASNQGVTTDISNLDLNEAGGARRIILVE